MGMDKAVTRYFKIGTFGFVLAKVLGDELLFGPIHVGGYFAWMTLAEGGSLQVLLASNRNLQIHAHSDMPIGAAFLMTSTRNQFCDQQYAHAQLLSNPCCYDSLANHQFSKSALCLDKHIEIFGSPVWVKLK